MEQNILLKGLEQGVKQNLLGNVKERMLWSCNFDRRFSYFVYVPVVRCQQSFSSKLMVFIHGTARRYETEQYEIYKSFAEVNNCVILFPQFPAGAVASDDYNDYKLIVSGEFRYDELLLHMVKEVAERYDNITITKFYLAGHSGGGQFVNRFLYLHPERLSGVSIGAPGRPTYLDDSKCYYWGTKDWQEIFAKKIDFVALRKVPIQLVVGEKDIKFIGSSVYGTNRNERLSSLQANFLAKGMTVEKIVVPHMEHHLTREGFAEPCNFFQKLIKKGCSNNYE